MAFSISLESKEEPNGKNYTLPAYVGFPKRISRGMISSEVVVADRWAPPPLVAREIPAPVLKAPLDTGANADVE